MFQPSTKRSSFGKAAAMKIKNYHLKNHSGYYPFYQHGITL